MNQLLKSENCSLYSLNEDHYSVKSVIASTPETRAILNDPFITGVKYTGMMESACAGILASIRELNLFELFEDEAVVLHILRGGLNFGLREALSDAFKWNNHASAFISAQRARKTHEPEEWYITESEYRKVYLPKKFSLVFGDVVATGTSLKHALKDILNTVKKQNAQLKGILFFTIGGQKAEDILAEIDRECRQEFPEYCNSLLVYLEGCFSVADPETEISIKVDGTDLLRKDAVMAPEFIKSQYENPSYSLERCVIYDAGSRAFWLPEYLEDVRIYWEKTLQLAEGGMTFRELLKERLPDLDFNRFGQVDLKEIASRQVEKSGF